MNLQALKGYPASVTVSTTAAGNPPAPIADAPKPVEAPVPQAPPRISREEVEKALEQVKVEMKSKASALEFQLDDQTGQTIIRVVDSETGDVIRQIPSEELVEIARALDKMQGMLLKQSA